MECHRRPTLLLLHLIVSLLHSFAPRGLHDVRLAGWSAASKASCSQEPNRSGKLEHYLVDVTPTPVFTRLEGLDNRVVGRVEMLRRVLILRGVTTSDMPANQALAQVNPAIANFQTVLTAIRARCDLSYLIQVTTLYCHVSTPFMTLILAIVL